MATLILTIALEFGLPANYVLAIAYTENPQLVPTAIHHNRDGSIDRGLMQLNNSWYNGNWSDPETNIRAACGHIISLRARGLSWWQVAVAYNCGIKYIIDGNPPDVSITYANKVFALWHRLENKKYLGGGL
jgi:hypothetical protein